MARRPRNEIDAGVHHVYARGVDRCVIFRDDEDRRTYLRILRSVVELQGWYCLAYCLMTNHVHLLIETRKPNLGRGMHRAHGAYAMGFNEKHGRVGHLFQSRYGSRAVHDGVGVASVFGYIAANPVAAALCGRPEDWEWSSYAATVDGLVDPLVDRERLEAHLWETRLTCAEIVEARLLSRAKRGLS